MTNKKILCVIPARIGSTRLPAKPLIEIKKLPLVMWTYNAAVNSGIFDKVLVATDDRKIFDTVTRHGGNAVMTSPDHESGTDRVCEAASGLPYDFIVNLQGDEPLIPAGLLFTLAEHITFIDDNSLLTCVSNATIDDVKNPNIVKVVCAINGDALYFSRAGIPFDRDNRSATALRHCGIYAFTKSGLIRFCKMPHGKLEKIERLEQLRALENGMRIRCFSYEYRAIGIDTPEDVTAFSAMVEG
ncbi:MAG TPA: 3-deoxy-manno-octulosonate cytidylyltransferase [Fibrobacteres bacterium]|jgi:3-deoxy-D-manno-octulosonate cytidylyltransferase|nr:3-deoxy-manno-octulosonate cytidylyltransferase [Fibrobacterota bacterium]